MWKWLEKMRKPKPEPRKELDYKIEASEYMRGDVKIVHNIEQNRLQLLFDGKPDDEMRAKLKSRGYRWSPRNKAWQRQLTPNAILSLNYVLPENKEA